MPPAVIAVGSAAFAASAAYSAGIVIFGTTIVAAGATAAIAAGGAVLALGFATTALAGKPKAPQFTMPERQLSDRLQSIRQPISTGKLHYGRLRIGGAQTFAEKTGDGTTHILYTLGVGPYAGMDELWFGDEQVGLGSYSAGGGYEVTGKFAGKAKVWFGNGTTAGDADLHAALTAAVGSDKWGANDKQTGWAKLYIQIVWNNDLYPAGIPNVTAVCRCLNNIVDPRVSGSPTASGWTDNAALCVANYLTTPKNWGGFGASWSEIDEAELIAAANACDEMVARKEASVTFTAATSDVLTVADKTAALRTGTRLTVSSSGTLPGGLTAATNYYWIATGPLTGKLATSLANARARVAIDITSAGSGTHTLTVNAEPRYTCNGTVDSVDTPEKIIGEILSAMAGRLLRNQGQWKIRAGVWQGADGALGQNDLIEGFRVNWFREPRDVFNGVKGTFMDPDSSWQPTDFPAVSVAAYLEADQGERVWKDADLPFTVSPSMAQRICRIDLERNRRQISTGWVTKLTALDIAAGDIVALDWDRYGWTGKYFECSSYKPTLRRDDKGSPYLCLSLGFAEMDENVYAWTPADDEDAFSPSPRTNLPSASDVGEPGPPAVTEELYETTSSRGVAAKALLSWAASEDAFVIEYQVEYRLVGATDWVVLPRTPLTTAEVPDIAPGVYDFRVKAINYLLASSDYATTRQEIYGLGAAPSTPTALNLQKFGGQAFITLALHPDLDVRINGRLYVRHSEALSGAEWSQSFTIGSDEGYPGSSEHILLPLKSGSYLIRAVDSSGIQSESWATVTTDGADIREFAEVDLIQEDDEFAGMHDGCVAVDGIMKLGGTGLFDDIPDFDEVASLDDFGGVTAEGTYEFASGFDFGVKTRARLISLLDGIVSNVNDLIDSRETNIDDWVDFDGDDGGSNADCWIEARTTDDDPASSPAVWSEWNRVDATEVYCRGVEFRSQMRSYDPAFNIIVSQMRVKVEELA